MIGAQTVDASIARPDVTQDLLLAETHHRMMNTLTLMAGSLRREFAPFRDTTIRDAISRHERTILAYGDLHACLTVGSHRNKAPFGDYLARLCQALAGAILHPLGLSCEVEAMEGFEPACQQERIGLVVAELVTNAAKHAFKGRASGGVRITLGRKGNGWQLVVADDGNGIACGAHGIGTDLIATLVKAAQGTLAMSTGPSGTSFAVTFQHDGGSRGVSARTFDYVAMTADPRSKGDTTLERSTRTSALRRHRPTKAAPR